MFNPTIDRAAFMVGAGALACALAGCSSSDGTASGGGAAKAATTADAACVDDNANVTVYAVINLSGKDLVSLLKHQNYEWKGKSSGYCAVDDAGFFAFTFSEVSNDVEKLASSAVTFGKSEYEELEPGAGEEPVAMMLSVSGYSTGEEALEGAIGDKDAVEDTCATDDSQYRLVKGIDGNRYVISAYNSEDDGDNAHDIYIYNNAFIKTGYLSGGKQMSVGTFWSALKNA